MAVGPRVYFARRHRAASEGNGLTITPKRLVFDAIFQLSKLASIGDFTREEDLVKDLALLARAYGVEATTASLLDDEAANPSGYFSTVADYYAGTEAQYSGVHSPEGAVHFGLDWDGEFHREGFYGQARIVEELLRGNGARDVLELGSGKGFNSIELARRNPDVAFTGVELTPLHAQIATERGRELTNLRFVECDFQRLAHAGDRSVDLVFDVEAGCHADTPQRLGALLSEVRRVLRPGGLFVQFGFFRSSDFDALTGPVRLAAQLVERAWVIEAFHTELEWKRAAAQVGMDPRDRKDLRAASLPSLRRIHQQAKFFYTVMATAARPLFAPLVKQSTHNSVSALMLPYAYELGSVEYTLNVLAAS